MTDRASPETRDIGTVEDRFFTIRDFRARQRHGHARGDDRLRTYGRLAPHGRNAVLITHGFTGSHHAAGRNPANGNLPGSWDGLIGPGKAIDTDRLFVVASNMLGSSYGSTNAASINPGDRRALRPRFPGDHAPRHRRGAEGAARFARRRAPGRRRRAVLRRLSGLSVGGRLSRLHRCDRRGQHRAVGLGQHRQAACRDAGAARHRSRMAWRALLRQRRRQDGADRDPGRDPEALRHRGEPHAALSRPGRARGGDPRGSPRTGRRTGTPTRC